MSTGTPPSRSLRLLVMFIASVSICLVAIILVSASAPITSNSPKPKRAFKVQNGYLWTDGAPFFPIGLFGADDSYSPTPRPKTGSHGVDQLELFQELKEAGFDTVQTYNFRVKFLRQYLKMAEKSGLNVIAFPGAKVHRDGWAPAVFAETVPRLRDYPSMLSWYLEDGLKPEKIQPSIFRDASAALRSLDSTRPIAAVIREARHVSAYAPSIDILMIYRYPVPKDPIVEVARYQVAFRRAMSNHKALWVIIQAFGYQSKLLKGWGRRREPTYEEMRGMTYLAVVHGATGIFYFAYRGSTEYYIRNSPQHWENLKRLAGELQQLYPVLLTPSSKEEVVVRLQSQVGKLSIAARGGDEELDLTAPIHYVVKRLENRPYLIAVNAYEKPLQVTFSQLPYPDGEVPVLFEERSIKVLERTMSDTFGPYEVHIYGKPQQH